MPEGKWIAIAKNKVVATSSRADEAFKIACKKYSPKEISLAKVPLQQALVLTEGSESGASFRTALAAFKCKLGDCFLQIEGATE